MSISKITEDEIYSGSIERLSDRPSASSRYGVGGISPSELKKKFDILPKLAIAKLNNVIDKLNDDVGDSTDSASESGSLFARVKKNADGIEALPSQYMSVGESGKSMNSLLAALNSAISDRGSISMSYDDDGQRWVFTFTPS